MTKFIICSSVRSLTRSHLHSQPFWKLPNKFGWGWEAFIICPYQKCWKLCWYTRKHEIWFLFSENVAIILSSEFDSLWFVRSCVYVCVYLCGRKGGMRSRDGRVKTTRVKRKCPFGKWILPIKVHITYTLMFPKFSNSECWIEMGLCAHREKKV